MTIEDAPPSSRRARREARKSESADASAAPVTTGFTVQGAVEAIRYYGGDPVGIASIFASVKECAGYPVASIFDTHDLPDYETYDSHSCPWCRQGQTIDALVNSFGYSSL